MDPALQTTIIAGVLAIFPGLAALVWQVIRELQKRKLEEEQESAQVIVSKADAAQKITDSATDIVDLVHKEISTIREDTRQQVSTLNEKIAELRKTIEGKDKVILDLQNHLVSCDARITEQNKIIQAQEIRITEQSKVMQAQDEKITMQEQLIVSLQAQLAGLQGKEGTDDAGKTSEGC